MKLGTPLSPAALRVMLLGAGELGKEVIIALQRLGVEVIAVDRYPNAPGHQVAHRAHVVSMTDAAALRVVVALGLGAGGRDGEQQGCEEGGPHAGKSPRRSWRQWGSNRAMVTRFSMPSSSSSVVGTAWVESARSPSRGR